MKRRAKAVSDKERLDWLERSAPHLDDSCQGRMRVYLESDGIVYREKTIRKSIDAAIRASRKRGGK